MVALSSRNVPGYAGSDGGVLWDKRYKIYKVCQRARSKFAGARVLSRSHACMLCVQEFSAEYQGQPWVQEFQEKLIRHSSSLEAICKLSKAATDEFEDFRLAAACAKKRRVDGSEATTPLPSATSSPQKQLRAGAAPADEDDASAASRTPTRERGSCGSSRRRA